jgi:hypothetical protein
MRPKGIATRPLSLRVSGLVFLESFYSFYYRIASCVVATRASPKTKWLLLEQ